MTVKDLQAALAVFAPEMRINVRIEREMTVTEPTGDRISGWVDDAFAVENLCEGEMFSCATGWEPVVNLCIEGG